MICAPSDEKNLEDVERLLEKQIPRIESPGSTSEVWSEEAPTQEAAKEEAPKAKRGRGGRARKSSAGKAARRDDEPVIGMGDHLPGFIEKSFEERMAS